MATKAGQWSDPQTRMSFGRNVAVAAQLQGIPLSSLSKNTLIQPELLWEILEGVVWLNDEQIDKICRELKLEPHVLFEHYPDNTKRLQGLAQNIPKERSILTTFEVTAQPPQNTEGVDVMKALGLTEAQLRAPERREAFAANLRQCLQLLGMEPESIAIRAEFTNEQVAAILRGGFALTNDAITAISHVIGLMPADMLTDYVSDGERFQRLQIKLQQAGKIAAPDVNGSTATKTDTEPNNQASTTYVAQPFDEGAMPSWNDEDLVATFANGETFSLLHKGLRAAILQRLRDVNPYPSVADLLRNTDGMEKKQSSWFKQIEDGNGRIYGTQLDSFAQSVNASVYWLLTGESDPNESSDEDPQAAYVESGVETPSEEPPALVPPADAELVETPDSAMVLEDVRADDVSSATGGESAVEAPPEEPETADSTTEAVLVDAPEPLILAADEPPSEVEPTTTDVAEPEPEIEPETLAVEELIPVSPAEATPENPEPEENPIMGKTSDAPESADKVPEWDEFGTFVSYGDEEFDLEDTQLRFEIFSRLEVYLAEGQTYKNFVEVTLGLGDKGSGWFNGVKSGKRLLYRRELETIAEYLGVTVYSLLTEEKQLTEGGVLEAGDAFDNEADPAESSEQADDLPEGTKEEVAEGETAAADTDEPTDEPTTDQSDDDKPIGEVEAAVTEAAATEAQPAASNDFRATCRRLLLSLDPTGYYTANYLQELATKPEGEVDWFDESLGGTKLGVDLQLIIKRLEAAGGKEFATEYVMSVVALRNYP